MQHARSLTAILVASAASVATLGCGAVPDDLVDARRVDAYVPPTIQLDYGGTYAVAGTWDLSRPFGGDGLGGVVADLMIDQIISLAGVPSALEDEARAAIAGQIRQPVVTYVNGVIPTALLTSNPTMMALDAIFSAVGVTGTLTLTAGADPDNAAGTDTITGLTVTHQATTITIAMSELLGGAVSVAADVRGTATGAATLRLGPHDLQLRFGELVKIVARDALGVDVFALATQAWAGVSCPALVDAFTGGAAGYTITVASQQFTVPDAMLEGACGTLKTTLAAHALGMFRRDAGVRLGGSVRFTADAGGAATSVTSEAGYGGAITLFPVVEPAMTATFAGTR